MKKISMRPGLLLGSNRQSADRSDSKNGRLVGSTTVAHRFAQSVQVFFFLPWLKAHKKQETPTPKNQPPKVLSDTPYIINHEQKHGAPLDDSGHDIGKFHPSTSSETELPKHSMLVPKATYFVPWHEPSLRGPQAGCFRSLLFWWQ